MDFLLTAAFAALVGMGVGSGGLYLIFLTLNRGIEQLTAQGMNLYFFLAASAGAAVLHLFRRRGDLLAATVLGGVGAAAAAGGAALAGVLDGGLLRRLFGGFMVISGVFAFLKK